MTTIESLELAIKKELLSEVLNSGGVFDLMSLDKLKELFSELTRIKTNNISINNTSDLEKVLEEDCMNMRAIEERMNNARARLRDE